MPSVSLPQHRWIEFIRHNPAALHQSGMSQAKADEWAKADTGSPWKHAYGGIVQHRDAGGTINNLSPGENLNPAVQSQVQQYSSLPTEKLQELASRLAGTSQAALVQKVLQQRELMPQTNPGTQPPPQQAQPTTAPPPSASFARGGTIKRDVGGYTPFYVRSEAREDDNSGFLHGTTPGRADSVQTTAPGGAYVIPADVVSGLGEGNSLAGARVVQAALETGPHGIPQARASGRTSAPRPPPAFREEAKHGRASASVPGTKERRQDKRHAGCAVTRRVRFGTGTCHALGQR